MSNVLHALALSMVLGALGVLVWHWRLWRQPTLLLVMWALVYW